MALLALWNPNIQFLRTDGTINAGGKIIVTDHNDAESIPANYSDADGTTLNSSPIVLDALGRATCYIDDGSTYDLYVKDANGAKLWTVPEMTPGTETIVVRGGFSVSSKDRSVAVTISVDSDGGTKYDLSIQKEIDRATEAEKGLADAIEAEKTRAEGVESTLSESISKETERAIKAEKASRAEIVAGDNITVEKTTGEDGHDIYTINGEKGIDAATANPLMDGIASAGVSTKYAREDHVHPTDTSREDKANKTTVVLGTSDSKYPTDKAVAEFVNSSIATNTANYISNNGEPFTSVEQLEAYSGTVTNNDYAFVTGTDSDGNTYYDRYKATVNDSSVTWALEYRLNNSSFTAAQWSAINSGITSVLVAKIHDHSNKDVLDGITSDKVNSWDGKEDAFDILPTTKGGTGTNAASKSELTSTLINSLTSGVATPSDDDYYVSQFAGGGTTTTSYHRRPVSSLWNYIKEKISSVLGLTSSSYSGKAATAGTADKAVSDNSGNNIEETYATKTELSTHTGDTTVHITAAERTSWNAKQSALTFDTTPTAGSTNPVTSNGIRTMNPLIHRFDNETSSRLIIWTKESTSGYFYDIIRKFGLQYGVMNDLLFSNSLHKENTATVTIQILNGSRVLTTAIKRLKASIFKDASEKSYFALWLDGSISQPGSAYYADYYPDFAEKETAVQHFTIFDPSKYTLVRDLTIKYIPLTLPSPSAGVLTSDGTSNSWSSVLPLEKGGTGASNASTARTNLSVPSKEDFESHTGNETVHITDDERTAWNNKLNVDGSNATNEGVTAMMRKVPSGTGHLSDESSYFGDSDSDHAKIVRRPVLDIWNYVKYKLGSAGSSERPIYIENGVPKACDTVLPCSVINSGTATGYGVFVGGNSAVASSTRCYCAFLLTATASPDWVAHTYIGTFTFRNGSVLNYELKCLTGTPKNPMRIAVAYNNNSDSTYTFGVYVIPADPTVNTYANYKLTRIASSSFTWACTAINASECAALDNDGAKPALVPMRLFFDGGGENVKTTGGSWIPTFDKGTINKCRGIVDLSVQVDLSVINQTTYVGTLSTYTITLVNSAGTDILNSTLHQTGIMPRQTKSSTSGGTVDISHTHRFVFPITSSSNLFAGYRPKITLPSNYPLDSKAEVSVSAICSGIVLPYYGKDTSF